MAETKSAVAIVQRRAVIETNIERCRDAAAENIVEIGRWLCRAKDEGIVPHGEWTGWVLEHAGMNERTAQRAMQIARELPEGSALARLGVAKISSLLTLPAAEREEVAERISAETISSREVDERVKAIRAERDEAYRVMGSQKAKLQRMQSELEQAKREAQAMPDPQQARRIELLEAQLRSRDEAIRQRDQEIDRLSDQLDEAQVAALRGGMTGEERTAAGTRILSAIGAFMAEAGTAVGELERTMGMLDTESRDVLIGQATLLGQLAMRVIAVCGGDASAAE